MEPVSTKTLNLESSLSADIFGDHHCRGHFHRKKTKVPRIGETTISVWNGSHSRSLVLGHGRSQRILCGKRRSTDLAASRTGSSRIEFSRSKRRVQRRTESTLVLSPDERKGKGRQNTEVGFWPKMKRSNIAQLKSRTRCTRSRKIGHWARECVETSQSEESGLRDEKARTKTSVFLWCE